MLQRLGAKRREQRDGDGAELIDGDMHVSRFGRLRQQDADAIAARNVVDAEQICGLIGEVAELTVGKFAGTVRAYVDEREAFRLRGRPAVADIDADIVARRHLPAE